MNRQDQASSRHPAALCGHVRSQLSRGGAQPAMYGRGVCVCVCYRVQHRVETGRHLHCTPGTGTSEATGEAPVIPLLHSPGRNRLKKSAQHHRTHVTKLP